MASSNKKYAKFIAVSVWINMYNTANNFEMFPNMSTHNQLCLLTLLVLSYVNVHPYFF